MLFETRLLLIICIVLFPCGITSAQLANGSDLRSLSRNQYGEFRNLIIKQYQKDPQALAADAKDVLIGMLGLEQKPDFQVIFDKDINFNVNSMLLLVANASKVKLEPAFIEEYKKQSAAVGKLFIENTQTVFVEAISSLLLRENAKL